MLLSSVRGPSRTDKIVLLNIAYFTQENKPTIYLKYDMKVTLKISNMNIWTSNVNCLEWTFGVAMKINSIWVAAC